MTASWYPAGAEQRPDDRLVGALHGFHHYAAVKTAIDAATIMKSGTRRPSSRTNDGLRMAPDVSLEEGAWLARAMTFMNAAADLSFLDPDQLVSASSSYYSLVTIGDRARKIQRVGVPSASS